MEAVIIILKIMFSLCGVYMAVLGLLGLKRPRPILPGRRKQRFVCRIAARNEESVIAEAVAGLKNQNYPAELVEVIVVPNNCTDGTADRANAAGATVWECTEGARCKGDALHYAVDRLLREGDFDVLCVFDADNIAHPDFISRMNDAFCAGARVAKGALRVKNPYDSWVSGCYGLYFTLFDRFYSRPRMTLGLSSKLVGTGFGVSRQVLAELGGWNTATLAEDAEFSAQCVAKGERVWFVELAVTYDEAPRDFLTSLRQRRRWCSGLMDVAARMDKPLVCALRGADPLRVLDFLIFLNYPFVYLASLIPSAASLMLHACRGEMPIYIMMVLVEAGVLYLGCVAAGAVLARIAGLGDGRIVPTLLGFPYSWPPGCRCSCFPCSGEYDIGSPYPTAGCENKIN